MRVPLLCSLALVLTLPLACSRRDEAKDYDRRLAPGEIALEEVPLAEWPDFSLRGQNRGDLLTAIDHSLAYLDKPSASGRFPVAGVGLEEVRSGLVRFRRLVADGVSDAALAAALRRDFRVFRSVGWNGDGTVLFTGYYTPVFEARLARDERFRYPVHRLPDDLVKGPDGKTVARQRRPDGSTRPYPTAAALRRSGALAGLELAWFEDPYEAYIVVVQGSAKLRLGNGSLYEIGYAGTNGHPYHSIGRDLVAEGRLQAEELSLSGLRRFFREHPGEVQRYIDRNPRYVFFQPASGGPFGSLGAPVTSDVTIATDKRIFPRAALCFVVTESPGRDGRPRPYRGFRCDQDTGGAISAPGRADLYMGVGAAAERRAGHQLAEGQLYYLVGR